MNKAHIVGADRFGKISNEQRLFGLSPSAFRVVVAVMSCERAERGYPSRMAIADMSACDETGMPSRLIRAGWLERADSEGNVAYYRATDKAWDTFGEERPSGKVAA